MSITRQNVPITEVWDRTTWANWDTYQDITNASILGRIQDPVNYPYSVFDQQHIDLRTFIEGTWTVGTAGYVSAVNHWPGLSIAASTGLTTTTSNYTDPVDLTAIGSESALVLTLPSFPLSDINLSASYIDLSSDNFGAATCSLQWVASTHTVTSGNTYLLFPYSALTGVDLTQVTNVRFRITATTGCTVYLMALRLIGNDWVSTTVDFDNLDGQLRSCIPLNGNTAYSVPANQQMPILWRSAQIPGIDDPRPINSRMGVIFNTGSQAHANNLTLYLRENSESEITQLDLQGIPQSALTGLPQPTSGVSQYVPRTMGDLNTLTMGELNTLTMLEMEEIESVSDSSWQAFEIAWGSSPEVNLFNSANPSGGYTYTGGAAPTFSDNTEYFALIDLTEGRARLQIYTVGISQYLSALIFDTAAIHDTSTFMREPGRIGFQAILGDGDTYVKEIRPNKLMFAEYRSAPLESITPVKGCRLYAQFTPNTQLWSSWQGNADGSDNEPAVLPDQSRTLSGSSTSVTVTTPSNMTPAQGVISNLLSPFDDSISGITDFNDLVISFALWFPSSALVSTYENLPPLTAALLNDTGSGIQLTMPPIIPDQWQTVTLTVPPSSNLYQLETFAANYPETTEYPSTTDYPSIGASLEVEIAAGLPYPAGLYQLALFYNGLIPTTFWLDNVEIAQRAMKWSARSVVSDAWSSNYAPWTDFHELYNSDTDGVRFSTIGKQLQIRGQALRQDAAILGAIRTIPTYAELGRLVWSEEGVTTPPPPTATITTTAFADNTWTFSGLTSSGVNPIVDYQWSLGDGTFANQSVVTHSFDPLISATTYAITLTVIDTWGQVGTTTITVTT